MMAEKGFKAGLGAESERVLMALRSEITSREYQPGDRIPSERKLCDRFGVSRPTVRRAVQRLEHEGLIEVRGRSGMQVTDKAGGMRIISIMWAMTSSLLEVAHDEAMANGYVLAVYNQTRHDWKMEDEEKFLKNVLEQSHAGVLAHCSPYDDSHQGLLSKLEDEGIKVVHVEHSTDDLPPQSYVLPNYVQSGYMATRQLFRTGYDGVYFASSNLGSPFSGQVESGVQKGLEEQGLAYCRDEHCLEILPRVTQDEEAIGVVRRFMDRVEKPAGIVCSGGFAPALTAVLSQIGVRVPEDVGVVTNRLPGDEAHDIDRMEFDREYIIRRAIEYISSGKKQPLRELVEPKYVAEGTVRASNAKSSVVVGKESKF